MDWRDFLLFCKRLPRLKYQKQLDDAYILRLAQADAKGFQQGINSIQKLVDKFDGSYDKKRETCIRENWKIIRSRAGKVKQNAV